MNSTSPICPLSLSHQPITALSLSSTHHRLLSLDIQQCTHPYHFPNSTPKSMATTTTTGNHHSTGNHHPPPPKPTRKILSIFLKFIVMSLILSLFLLFIGLAAIVLLHLLLAGSFLHRRRRRLLSRSTTAPDSTLSLNDIQNHIPPFVYLEQSQSQSESAVDDCSICLEGFNGGEICRVLPVCDHVFHARCVDRWLTKVPNCPVCRSRIRLDVGGSSDSVVSDDETKFLWAIGVGR